MSKRTHIQFSGSLQPEDAAPIIKLLKEAVQRRPPNCGAVMRVQDLDRDQKDIAPYDKYGICLRIDEFIEATEKNK